MAVNVIQAVSRRATQRATKGATEDYPYGSIPQTARNTLTDWFGGPQDKSGKATSSGHSMDPHDNQVLLICVDRLAGVASCHGRATPLVSIWLSTVFTLPEMDYR